MKDESGGQRRRAVQLCNASVSGSLTHHAGGARGQPHYPQYNFAAVLQARRQSKDRKGLEGCRS